MFPPSRYLRYRVNFSYRERVILTFPGPGRIQHVDKNLLSAAYDYLLTQYKGRNPRSYTGAVGVV